MPGSGVAVIARTSMEPSGVPFPDNPNNPSQPPLAFRRVLLLSFRLMEKHELGGGRARQLVRTGGIADKTDREDP